MKTAYLDNAATTPMRPEVIEKITESLQTNYANASATYAIGRKSKAIMEAARKQIASWIGVEAAEIIFTSGGTEANNLILNSCVRDLEVVHIITSKIEHHAVLNTVKALQKYFNLQVSYVKILPTGDICMNSLKMLLEKSDLKTLVSLMHINNEIGTVLNLEAVAELCKNYKALFHTDMVQSVGHFPLNLIDSGVDFTSASAHKLYGPKGIGFAMIKKNAGLKSMQFGGEQERGLRAGTEAIHQIEGMLVALNLAYQNLYSERDYISELKNYAVAEIRKQLPEVKFNAQTDQDHRNYNLLNICLPISNEKASTTLFKLDMEGICVSRGSACQSGSNKPSHVLAEFLNKEDLAKTSLRISFSIYNTNEDTDQLIKALKKILN